MRLRVSVAGGTRAGWRAPFIGKPLAWQCDCVVTTADVANPDIVHDEIKKTQIGALARCPDCGVRRPT